MKKRMKNVNPTTPRSDDERQGRKIQQQQQQETTTRDCADFEITINPNKK
jgi:hypothetical protein